MFKQRPIQYAVTFGTMPGEQFGWFESQVDELYIRNKTVIVEPFQWESGYAINFWMKQCCARNVCWKIEKIVASDRGYYDKAYPQLRHILGALASGDARGSHAEGMIFDIFRETYAISDVVQKELPLYYEFLMRSKDDIGKAIVWAGNIRSKYEKKERESLAF